MINVYYLIRKILQEMGDKNYKKLDFKISLKTLEKYEDWWKYYKHL